MNFVIFLVGCLAAIESIEAADVTAGPSNQTFNITTRPPNTDEQLDRMPSEITIPSAVGVTILSCVAFLGNVFTICSFITDVRLRTVYDMYIVNLAVADLCIACISIPIYVIYSLNVQWPFERVLCKTWLVADFTLCLETVIMIIIISLDRLLYIKLGMLQYMSRVTSCLAKIQIFVSWLLAFLIYSPAIIWWDVWVGHSTVKETECHVEFAYDVVFTATTAITEFFIPVFVLTLINGVIYKDVRVLIKRRRKIAPEMMDMSSICASARPSGSGCRVLHWSHKPRKARTPLFRHRNSYDLHNARDTPEFELDNKLRHLRLSSLPEDIRNRHLGDSWCQKDPGNVLKTKTQTRSFLKAARSLALLVVVFIIFWAPYTILTVFLSFCGKSCVNPILYEFFYWWLWVKSAVNPFLYAYSNSKYRSNFHRLLTCLFKDTHHI